MANQNKLIKNRFRGFLPVIVDVETGGLEPKKHALLEMATVLINSDENGTLSPGECIHFHIQPFEGAKLDKKSLEVNKIKPDHPFRFAVPEIEALEKSYAAVKKAVKEADCSRAVLVGHNAWFDLGFLTAANERCKITKTPFHKFTTFDTATLGGLAYGQTVLTQALKAAKIRYKADDLHSAKYDTMLTAELFCKIVNDFDKYHTNQVL